MLAYRSDRALNQWHRFPNAAQRIAYAWYRLPAAGKVVVMGLILGGLLRVVLSLPV